MSIPARRPAQLVGISLAYFMVLLDTTVLAVAEPDIMRSLDVGVVGVGWATTIYTLALASALVFGGGLADRVGAYPVFVGGVIGFGAASVACALSPDLAFLLVFRALLGLFAAAIVPSSLSLIAALYREPGPRGRAISVWAAISGVAMAAGPVLGGRLVTLDGWRAVFVINAPLALVVLVLCRTRVASARHARATSWLPHLGLAASLAVGTLAITQAGRRSWLLAGLLGLVALGAAYGTVIVDRASAAPIVPAALRRNRAVWVGFGWGAAVNYALTTVIFSLPLLLHATAEEVGATLLPMTLLVALNPLATGRLVAAYGPLRPIRMGFVAFPIGLGFVAVATAGHDRPFVLGFGLLLCGLGVSWTLPALVGFAVGHAAPEAAGSVGGILNATRQVGATVAAAVASTTLTHRHDGGPAVVPFVIAAVVCVLGLISATMPHLSRSPDAEAPSASSRLPK
ncbi:MFS transporter [Actinomadura algeriensis]|uniref:DHA2 family methylenomycin A resistance protein-like MFS transporter n=1 Tax=Actinomadura algeriensis TaxID=1679523 RepID=A0ABR9JLD4_9ACTN|nr:MFS transporter [Actinomadura algeriensis]MBE1531254.1 DHA2 family methylenomycin A resistance protein-like MFS transporter [Actinomadura algeriensis]